MKKLILLFTVVLMLAACSSDTPETSDAPFSLSGNGEPPRTINLATTTIRDECSQADIQEPETRTYEQMGDALASGVDYHAILCTDAGAILIDLYEEQTPLTVNNFVFLAQANYYNNTIFHRVLEGFMAQAGDPTGTGSGGPGYRFNDEIVQGLEFDRRGLLAMANAGAGTNGSQFFITFEPTPHLNGAHTIFGEVVEGTRVLNGILRRNPDSDDPSTGLRTVLIVQLADS